MFTLKSLLIAAPAAFLFAAAPTPVVPAPAAASCS